MKKKFKYNPDHDVVRTKDVYSGEQSPYWNDLNRTAGERNARSGELQEPKRANPDAMSEDESLYHRPVAGVDEFKLEVIKDTISKLTTRQQQILQLHGYDGYTIKETAKELGLDESTVKSALEQIRLKILKCYRRDKEIDDSIKNS